MAGEPIIVAGNCAVIVINEPLARGEAPEGQSCRWALAPQMAEAIAAPYLDLCESRDFVVDDALMTRFNGLKRRSLILMGALLEGAVTQIALSTLLEGYDVYVCADQVATADPAREALFLERIRFCAGHIVTARQILLELLSREKDEKKREPMLALLNAGVRR
jgi:nicotinamidase-related amidase